MLPMHRQKSLSIADPAHQYDHCLITNYFKTLFAKANSPKTEPCITITQSAAGIADALAQMDTSHQPEMSYSHLAALEQSLPGVAFRYAVIYKGDVPVLCACFQLFTLGPQQFSLDKNKTFVKGIFRFFLELKKVRVLISGNAMRNHSANYVYNKQVLGEDEAVAALAAIAEKIAADERLAAVILRDLPACCTGTQNKLTSMGYQMPWQDRIMAMPIPAKWTTLDHYLADLSRKYKARARKTLAAGAPLRKEQMTVVDVTRQAKELCLLFEQVAGKQSFVLATPTPSYLLSLKELYGDGFEVTGYYEGEKLVGFYTAFVTEDCYEVYHIGMEYAANAQYQLYFNIMLAGLERGILLRKQQLRLGRTSFDAKASLGAVPETTRYLVKLGGIPDFVMKWFACYFNTLEDGQWKLRNPLKTAE